MGVHLQRKHISPALRRITSKHMNPARAKAAAAGIDIGPGLDESGAERGGFITEDPYCLSMIKFARELIYKQHSVLITGETGTGKEEIAKIIAGRMFKIDGVYIPGRMVACNCAGVVPTLFESEMFGHVAGAYTGSAGDRKGYFEAAHGHTLFLDEIGDLPPEQQAKLLRAIQTKKIIRVGDTREIPVNVRIVSATNRDLEQMVEDGKFREDLFMRIAQVRIHITPLRDRPHDVTLIARHICDTYFGGDDLIDGEPIPPWAYGRGNVRRLHNCFISRDLGYDWSEIEEQWGPRRTTS